MFSMGFGKETILFCKLDMLKSCFSRSICSWNLEGVKVCHSQTSKAYPLGSDESVSLT